MTMQTDIRGSAAAFGVPFRETIAPERFDPALIASLPVTWAREHAVLPVRAPDGGAELLMPGPESLALLQHASLAAGTELQPAFAERDVILRAIDAAYYAGRATSSAAARPEEEDGAESAAPDAASAARQDSDLLVERREPVARYLNDTLLEAVRKGASDVHFEPEGEEGARAYTRRGMMT